MKKGQNSNHPVKGSSIKVEPIRKLKDIKAIKKMLAENPRDLALFTIGINTNLRASDLLNLKVCQVIGLNSMDEIEITEKKTAKKRRISLNDACICTIKKLLASGVFHDNDYLFKSQRGAVLTAPSLHRLVSSWCREINLKGNYGSHTLRKTFGFHQRTTFGMGLPELMVVFNHATQRQTLEYLCVQADEIKSIYANQL